MAGWHHLTSDPPDYELDDEAAAEAEAELDRLAAEAGIVRREFPPDLIELGEAINMQAGIRLGLPDEPAYEFGRFEAYSFKMGGMSMIIKARDPVLDRMVAIKLWMTKGPESERALVAEAQLLAKLNHHPNVVTIFDSGKWRDRIYFVMEWVDGRDGHVWMREQRRRPWHEVRDTFVFAGRGLAEAHRLEILHRDFKPSNILIADDGRVLVADFGVSARMDSLIEEQEPCRQPGTPMYMAPERLRGYHGDERSDQFSFCAALWRALHGVRPYPGRETDEILAAIDSGTIRGIWDEDVIPRWLNRVVVRGLQADPNERHEDMNALLEALLDEPMEPSSVDDEIEVAEPPDDDERVLHGPVYDPGVLRAASDQERRQFFLYGALTGVSIMAALVLGLTPDHPIPTRATRSAPPTHETVTPPPAREAEEPPLEESPSETRVTPEDVIAEIDNGNYDDANELWRVERDHRYLEGDPTPAASVRVGEAFLEAGKRLAKEKKIEQAKKVKGFAAQWGHAAVTDFKSLGESPVPGNDLLDDLLEFEKTL